jgi:hypothetical protein
VAAGNAAAVLDPPFTLDGLRGDHPEVLAEGPMEVASYLVAAKALASGGHRENAIALLREGSVRHPEERDLQLRLAEQLLIGGDRVEGRALAAASVNLASSGRNHSDQVMMLILDLAVHGDGRALDETRRFIANLSNSSEIEMATILDLAWFFFQGHWNDPRVIEAETGWVHRWARVLQEWGRFEAGGGIDEALAAAAGFEDVAEIRGLAQVLEARVRLAEGDPTRASQIADQGLQRLTTGCRTEYESCAFVPLAQWVLGRALIELDGRAGEGRALLATAAAGAPGTWISEQSTG